MVWKDKKAEMWYNKGYYQGYKKATIIHLGGRCRKCGTKKRLQIHHINNLCRQRRNVKDLNNLSELQIYCQECHGEVDRGW